MDPKAEAMETASFKIPTVTTVSFFIFSLSSDGDGSLVEVYEGRC